MHAVSVNLKIVTVRFVRDRLLSSILLQKRLQFLMSLKNISTNQYNFSKYTPPGLDTLIRN